MSPPLEAVVAAASRLPLLAGSLLVFSAIAVPLLGFLAAPAHAAMHHDDEPCGFWDTGGCDGGSPAAAKLRFFGQVYAVVLAFQWTAYWAALALACACPSAAVALGAFPALLMVNLTLSGFNVPLPAVPKSNLQPDLNVVVFDSFDAMSSSVLRELGESNRFVQKSAESISICPS